MTSPFRFEPSTPLTSRRGRLLEGYRLSRAAALSGVLDETLREDLATRLRASAERSASAASLWGSNHRADGLRLAVEAFDDAHAVLDETREAVTAEDGERTRLDLLAALGVPDKARTLVERTHSTLDDRPLPSLESEIDAAAATDFVDARRAHLVIRRALAPALRPTAGVKRLRTKRLVATFAPLVVLITLILVAVLWPPPRIVARASATFDNRSRYQPAKVLDDDPASEWLLPNRSRGWIDLVFDEPRRVEKLRILNAVNGRRRDRGTKEYAVGVYRRGKRVRLVTGSFPSVQSRRTRRENFVHVGLSNVSKLRVEVRTWHKRGGGFAELTVH